MRTTTVTATLLLALLSTPALAENREHVTLNDTQKTYVLGHMKTMLEAIAQINQHLADQQPERVAILVKDMQKASHQSKPKGLGKSFPDGFRAFSRQMNQHWKTLMTPTSDISKVNREMSNILTQCNACHRSYKLK